MYCFFGLFGQTFSGHTKHARRSKKVYSSAQRRVPCVAPATEAVDNAAAVARLTFGHYCSILET